MRLSTPLLLVAPLAGCAATKADDTAAMSPTGDATTVPTDACGGYQGINAEGDAWSYAYTGDLTGTLAVRVAAITQSGATTVSEGQWEGDGLTYRYNTTTDYACNTEGVYAIHQVRSYQYTSDGQSSGDTRVYTYETACGDTRPGMAAGDAWDCSIVGIAEGASYGGAAFSYDVHVEVSAGGTVTVPGGTWDTLLVTRTTDYDGTEATDRLWLADGVGLIQADTLELTSWTP